jgi:hypothetical protein
MPRIISFVPIPAFQPSFVLLEQVASPVHAA